MVAHRRRRARGWFRRPSSPAPQGRRVGTNTLPGASWGHLHRSRVEHPAATRGCQDSRTPKGDGCRPGRRRRALDLRRPGAHRGRRRRHLPAARVVFTGDVLFRLCTPIGWEGTFECWIAGSTRSWHSTPPWCARPRPALGRRGAARDAGLPPLRARRDEALLRRRAPGARGGAAHRTWARTRAGNEPERILFNVERAYRELRGEPYDAPIDVTALFRAMYELREARRAGA